MFGPDYQDIACPACCRWKVYSDREIGHYCMFCGHELSAEEAYTLIAREVSAAATENCLESSEKYGSGDRFGDLAAVLDRLRTLHEVARWRPKFVHFLTKNAAVLRHRLHL